MNKYYAIMKDDNGKETVTQSWNLQSLNEWIKHNENLGYKLVSRV